MLVVTVMYPNTDGSKFDRDYYVNTHIPLVDRHWTGHGYQGAELIEGLGGGGPGEPATYQVMAILRFDDMDAFQNCLGRGGEEIMADVANFTDVQPILQVSQPFG